MAKIENDVSISKLFVQWEDADVSRYLLACCLGLLEFDYNFRSFRDHKGVFWTNNRISSMLDPILNNLVELGSSKRTMTHSFVSRASIARLSRSHTVDGIRPRFET